LTPTLPAEPTLEGIAFGQDLYFLGFPYGLFSESGDLNNHYPFPFVKKGILSATGEGFGDPGIFFIDGHNNPGFSGGPVVFVPYGKKEFRIAGVVSGFQTVGEPVYDQVGSASHFFKVNTGLMVAYNIHGALEAIKANPIGFALP